MSDQSNISAPISSGDTPAADTPAAEPTSTQPAEDSMEGVETTAPAAPEKAETATAPPSDPASAAAPTSTASADAPAGAEPTAMDEDTRQPTPEPPKKRTYVDYLRSPIVTINVTSPPTDTAPESTTSLSAHLSLLQTSPYLARMCSSFTPTTPAEDRVLSLPGHSLDTVGAFLEYLYTGEYTPRLVAGAGADELVLEEIEGESTDRDDDGEELLKHARIYTLAEQLEMPLLKELAHSKIHRINSSARGELRYARYVYKHTTREDKTIRQPIASFWAHRSHVLRHDAEDDFRRMILEFPQFAYDILSIVLDQKEKSKASRREAAQSQNDDPHFNPQTPAEKAPRSNRKRARTSMLMG